MPYKDKTKRNEYQRKYKRDRAAELKRLREQTQTDGKIPMTKDEKHE